MLKGSLLHSVAGRVTAFTALGAAAIGATLGLFFAANTKLKSANEDNARAAAISAASFDLRAHVIDLDNAFQAVITSDGRRFLAQWHAAERAWRRPALQLEQAASQNAGEEHRAQLLERVDRVLHLRLRRAGDRDRPDLAGRGTLVRRERRGVAAHRGRS